MSVRVRMNSRGARDLLKSPAIQADLAERARRIAAAAGPGFTAASTVGSTRAFASVTAGTYAARAAEAGSHALIRALGAGR